MAVAVTRRATSLFSRVPPESSQFPAKFAYRASKSCVCNARRLQAIRLLTERLYQRSDDSSNHGSEAKAG